MNKLFNTLPEKVQNEIRETLKAFHRVNVTYYCGEYHVETGDFLLANYPADFEAVGEFKDSEIFTPEEMIVNYVESFHEYPPKYTGRRDYSIFKGATWSTRYQMNAAGDIVRI